MKPFHYTKFSPPTTEIRLLRLLPDQPGTPIRAKIYTFPLLPNLKGCPRFAAISYTWGTPSQPTIPIQINDALLPVHATVHELLLQLRDSRTQFPRQPHFLWIYGVCINQENVEERNHQVKLMRGVYLSAEMVMVWLGDGDEKSDEAMDYLGGLKKEKLGRTGRRVVRQVRVEGRGEEHGLGGKRGMYFGDEDVEGAAGGEMRQSVAALLRREYWGRMWIVQEVLLAKKLVVLCGTKRISWKRLDNFFGPVEYHLTRSPARFFCRGSAALTIQAYRLATARAYFEVENPAREGLPFLELWNVFCANRCTDVRDKVYALLGLSRDEIEIDYRKSAQQVYDDVAAYVERVYGIWDRRDAGLLLLARHLGVSKELRTIRPGLRIDGSKPELKLNESGLRLHDSSLANLGRHFDNVMEHISHELDRLTEECNTVTLETYDSMGRVTDNADAEIARFQSIMQRMDALEMDFDRIAQIRDIVRAFRIRAEELEAMFDMGTA